MKFKVGDRVSAQCEDSEGEVLMLDVRGTFDGINEEGFAIVTVAEGFYLCVPKSLRRLVKKQRRRVWVYSDDNGELAYFVPDKPSPFYENYIEFIEVRKKK